MADSPRPFRIAIAGAVTGIVLFAFGRAATDETDPVIPEKVAIPAIDVDAPLMELGMTKGGDVELPPYEEPETAGWFKHSAVPGDEGATVIIGHVDTRTAPAVFYKLRQLKKGQVVRVARSDGKTVEYKVDSLEQVDKGRFPTKRVYLGEGLRLITCGGSFDWKTREYRDNVIVYASPVRPKRPSA
ncbi:LPXTG-site transpeptidase (sortase) family protein [Sinosporangium album]|uniref:LPXTG-site transpeptidase (Sortase) family protein n=1 Tax=Sinosporangium album TaxID=504805 RepID=A0A1G8D1U8_9ACTN|nr:class F sortase [Sinosporangium album]SDH51493.1 LPXTG-site transpeptidase (sortase) family protein [Sinosporangium album]